MKSKGKNLREDAIFGPLSFKRKDELVTFFAQPVWDYKEFDELCPKPVNTAVAFVRNERGKAVKQVDPDAPEYKVALSGYDEQRWGYYVIKSLEPCFKPHGELEWEEVNPKKPLTWGLVEKELRSSLSFYEFTKVMSLIDEANALDAAKLEENAESFFRKQAEEAIKKAKSKAESTESSPPANDLM
jgi:hypothetical protein